MSVQNAQNKLIQLGYGEELRPYGADGKFGTKTSNATESFQKDYNRIFNKSIKVDGVPGPETNRALDHARNQAGVKGTKNFNISEFRCKGSGGLSKGGIDNNLLLKLEELRYDLGGNAIVINSGYRSVAHNRVVGGASGSQHLYGKAADIVVRGVSPSRVYSASDKFFNGVGRYNTFTHVDTRAWKARF
ncbi:D-Ala-D-Ala carboxypeptidase family metallohydrolase [Virgibacillus sp. C22-A2]|uniref:D-Ala-D-Ala carboxypeptidase family metallohydrolase n=1 Tax=Virgibacillus tibetensis TaxID=3042313 RepID=A0ABU6K9W3_9BACI|nr:D-Ala-D-Ala carboxypeptidase family metallohydrolase [Virgibacillus sp. C22-A2]